MPTRESTVFAVVTVILTVAILVVLLRFYIRHAIIRRVGLDDWAIAAALVIPPNILLTEPPLIFVMIDSRPSLLHVVLS